MILDKVTQRLFDASWMGALSKVNFLRTVAVCLMGASPILADRHCGPASEMYYAARQMLLDPAPGDAANVAEALSTLEDARLDAVICGCPAIIDTLTDLGRAARAPGLTPEAAAQIILQARSTLDAAERACHS